MKGFLLDTHVWFWYLVGSPKLPRGLRRAIDGALTECWLSPVSVWEVAMLAARKRIELAGGPRAWTEEAWRALPLHEADLNREIALRATELRLARRDPADRFIAATALVYELTLLTVDRRLARLRGLSTLSA